MRAHDPDVERELSEYFSGVFAGRMGLRSWLGPMLEHAQAATVSGSHEPAWNGHSPPPSQYVGIGKASSYVSSGDDSGPDRAMGAVRAERSIRAALCALDRADVLALLAWYRQVPPDALQGALAVAATRMGHATVRALQAAAEKPAKHLEGEALKAALTVRAEAKRALRAAERSGEHAAKIARERYAEARAAVEETSRATRRRRFEEALR